MSKKSSLNDVNVRWNPPPLRPTLLRDEVHVWLADLNQPDHVVEWLSRGLNQDEIQRSARFHFDKHRVHYVVARGILREILSRYLRIPPDAIRFRYGIRGKPSIDADTSSETIHFNAAHSGSYALYAISRHSQTGVDIEMVREIDDRDRIVDRNFSRSEAESYYQLPEKLRQEAFYNGWTQKEAYIKATGDGLYQPLDQFSVSITPGERAAILDIAGERETISQWRLVGFKPIPGYVAAVAIKGEIHSINCWVWQASDDLELKIE